MKTPIGSLPLLAMLAFPALANAATWTGVYYELTTETTPGSLTTLDPTWVSSSTGQAVETTQLLGGVASMTGSASPGVLKASVWNAASVTSQPSIGVSHYTTSHAIAAFNDQMTLMPVNASLIGQTVTVNGSFTLSGDMLGVYRVEGNNSVNFDTDARVHLQISGTGIAGVVGAREIQGLDGIYGPTNIHEPAPTLIPLSFTATLGSATSIQYNLDLQGIANASFGFRECGGGYGPCSAVASALQEGNYANSMLWGGISGVTDAYGNPVDLGSALGDTGFDYLNAAPVPVPAAVWLFGSGLMGLFGVARRRLPQ